MNVDLGIWDKLTRLVIFLLFIAGILVVAIWYLPLIRNNERFRKAILQKDAEIQKEEDTSRQLQAAIDAVHRDPKAVERLSRETIGFSKPDEIVVRFTPARTNSLTRH